MNGLKLFNFEDAEVRAVLINDEPYFVGKDVALILGYSNPQKAIRTHVDEDDQGVNEMDTPGGKQNLTVINESGLFSLILSSKLPTAKRFKRWVTFEVLPTIRKHGTYMTDKRIEEALQDPDTIIKIATQLKNERANRKLIERQVTEMKPKAIFADSVATSKTTILVGELAKIIKQNGISLGAKF